MNKHFGRAATLKAAVLVTGSTYINYGIGLIVSALIARVLGPNDYGLYAYVVWLIGLLITFSNNGITTSGIRFVSENLGREQTAEARHVHAWLWHKQVVSLAAVILVFALFAWFKPFGMKDLTAVIAAIVILGVIGKSVFLFDISIAKGYGKFTIEAQSTVITGILSLAGALILRAMHASLDAFLWLLVLLHLGGMIYGTILVKRQGIVRQTGPLDREFIARVKSHLLWTIVLITGSILSNKSIETFLLNGLVGHAAVGYFVIAGSVTRGGIDLLTSGLSTVLMPAMAHAYGAGGSERVRRILSDAVRYFLMFGLILAGVGGLWAKVIIVTLYGASYLEAVPILQVMVIVGGLTLADAAFGSMLSITDNQSGRAAVSLLSISVSAIASFALIPRYGLMGAMISHGLTRAFAFSVLAAVVIRTQKVRLPLGQIASLLVSAAIAAALTLSLKGMGSSPIGDLAEGVIYALILVISTILMRVWRRDEVGHLTTFLERFPRLNSLTHPALNLWIRHCNK